MKKFLSLFLAISMIIGFSVPAFAETDAVTSNLEKALTVVKSRIEIPEELNKFSSKSGYNGQNMSGYSLTWENSKKDKSINVVVFGDVINKYTITEKSKSSYGYSFGKLSNDDVIKKATAYIKKLNPTIYKKLQIENDKIEFSLSDNLVFVPFTRYEYGVPVPGNSGSLTIDKNTGRLLSFNLSWAHNVKFEDSKKKLSLTNVSSIYAKNAKYNTYYNTSSSEITLDTDISGIGSLNAFTGKTSTAKNNFKDAFEEKEIYFEVEDDVGIAGDNADLEEDIWDIDGDYAEGDDYDGGDIGFSDDELEALEKDKVETAAEKIRDLIVKNKLFGVTANYKISEAKFYKNNKNEDCLQLYLKESYSQYFKVNINLKTNMIYYVDASRNDLTQKFDEKKSDANVNALLDTYLKSSKSQLKAAKSDYTYKTETKVVLNPNTGKYEEKETKTKTSKTYVYSRYVNGYRVKGDYIKVKTNSENLVSYFDYKLETSKFPDATKLSNEKMLSSIIKAYPPKLEYYIDVNSKGVVTSNLVYIMPAKTFYLNAKTGQVYNDIKVESKTRYTDIKGKNIEAKATKLAEYGIYIGGKGGKFNANDIILEEDFNTLLYKINGGNSYISTMPKINKMTKAEAMQMFALVLTTQTELSDKKYQQSPYNDVSADNEYVSYISYMKSKGYIPKTANFEPEKMMTRAMAVELVYNYLEKQTAV